MDKLTLNAPAKINVGLNVVSKRTDGFHNLETFFYPVYDLHDTLIFRKSSYFIFDSNNSSLNKDPNNLILQAHSLIENHVNKKLPVNIKLLKRIPIGAGLGGGSSDAAAVLLGLTELFNLDIGLNKLKQLALVLGSDVPFFIKSKPCIGLSRGEILEESDNFIEKPILIINPGIHISTKEAFQKIVPKDNSFDYRYFVESNDLDFSLLREELKNDFENYVFEKYKDIKMIKTSMYELGAKLSLMSGTGSTVYGIFNSKSEAQHALNQFPSIYFRFISE